MPEEMSKELGPSYNPLYKDAPRELPYDIEEAQVHKAVGKALAVNPSGARPPGPGGEGYIDLAERMFYEGQARDAAKGSWFVEGLRKTENPQALTFLNRGILASWEENPKLFSEYTALHYAGILGDRAAGYRALVDVPREVLESLGLVGREGLFKTQLEGEALKKFLETLIAAKDEFIARTRVLEVYKQQLQMGGDTKSYGYQFFVAPWRVKTEARDYAAIGRAKETLPGKEKFGVLVDQAMRGWVDLAEGKETDLYGRSMGAPRDSQGRLNNPFNGYLFENDLERDRRWIAERKTGGDMQAVQLAWILLRHMDVHVSYALKGGRLVDPEKPTVGRRMEAILSAIGKFDPTNYNYLAPAYKQMCQDRGDLGSGMSQFTDEMEDAATRPADVEVEASDTTNDTAKAAFITVRQIAEFTKDNPRAVAAPATIGCFPNLTTDMMRMLSFGEHSMWELWREHGVRFGDFPWEEAQKTWRSPADHGLHRGLAKTVHHVPYGLQAMYACGKVYDSIMRTDFAKAGEDIIDPSYLHELNKAYDLTFAIMWGKYINLASDEQIERDPSKDTLKKLRQLTAKLNMLAGSAIANTHAKNNNPLKLIDRMGMPMVPDSLLMQSPRKARGHYVNLLIDAATKSGFLSIRDHQEGKKVVNGRSLYDIEVELLTEMVETRRLGYKPSALINKGLFTQTEIDRMDQLGVYAPFKA